MASDRVLRKLGQEARRASLIGADEPVTAATKARLAGFYVSGRRWESFTRPLPVWLGLTEYRFFLVGARGLIAANTLLSLITHGSGRMGISLQWICEDGSGVSISAQDAKDSDSFFSLLKQRRDLLWMSIPRHEQVKLKFLSGSLGLNWRNTTDTEELAQLETIIDLWVRGEAEATTPSWELGYVPSPVQLSTDIAGPGVSEQEPGLDK